MTDKTAPDLKDKRQQRRERIVMQIVERRLSGGMADATAAADQAITAAQKLVEWIEEK